MTMTMVDDLLSMLFMIVYLCCVHMHHLVHDRNLENKRPYLKIIDLFYLMKKININYLEKKPLSFSTQLEVYYCLRFEETS